jgi:hypothetical protein
VSPSRTRILSPTAQTSQRPPFGVREFADSPVEEGGFEPSVPGLFAKSPRASRRLHPDRERSLCQAPARI